MNIAILIFLGLALGLVFLFGFARIGALLAFLTAGIIMGPHVLNLWQISDTWHFLGGLGIMFLWFTIGLELNSKRLWEMRSTIFSFGAAQILTVVAMIFPLLFGLTHWSIISTLMIAMILAMSSTSGTLQVLADKNKIHTVMGRQTFSILLFQDLLSIPLLVMMPVLIGTTVNFGASAIDASMLTLGLIIGVIILARLIWNPLLRLISRARSKESFILFIIATIAIIAFGFEKIGFPAGIGAFLAGMILSETKFRHQILAEISPYQLMFMSFFFIALGIGLDLNILANHWDIVLMGLVGLFVVKFIAIYIVAKIRNIGDYDAFMMALILAQAGEFGLLFLQTMKQNGINAIPHIQSEILTAIILLSMIMMPVLVGVHSFLSRRGLFFKIWYREKSSLKLHNEITPIVFVCGFGRVGQVICDMLIEKNIPYVAIDMNADSVLAGQHRGYNVFYGDTTNKQVLWAFGMAPRKTRAVVLALDNSGVAKRTVRAVFGVWPRAKIFARVRTVEESNMLRKMGVMYTLSETRESSIILGTEVLEELGVKKRS